MGMIQAQIEKALAPALENALKPLFEQTKAMNEANKAKLVECINDMLGSFANLEKRVEIIEDQIRSLMCEEVQDNAIMDDRFAPDSRDSLP